MRKICLSIIMALCVGYALSAQGVLNVRINEVLVINENDIVDDYGQRESWVELFNTGFERVDVGGCYLGIRYADRRDQDGNKLIEKYYIPRNDPATKIEPLGYRIFYCDGTNSKGTFYTNFTIADHSSSFDENGTPIVNTTNPVDMIILYNGNGKDVISVFPLSADQQPDQAWGIIGHEEIESKVFPKLSGADRKSIGNNHDALLDAIASRLKYQPRRMHKTTPAATNEINEETPHHEIFKQKDPKGVVMALTAMSVVFLALVTIFVVFKIFGKIMIGRSRRKSEEHTVSSPSVSTPKGDGSNYTGEEIAAIAMALKLYQEDLHVDESTVITINRVSRMYSPWNSKIYGMTELPTKKNR